MTLLKTKINTKIILSCWIYSSLALLTSFFFEYTKEIQPCLFCKLQRLAFLGIFLISTSCLAFYCNFFVYYLLKILLILCFIFASVHLALQMSLIRDICSVPIKMSSIEAFKDLMYASKNSGCTAIPWKILGLPVSAFNAAFSLSIFLMVIFYGRVKKSGCQNTSFYLQMVNEFRKKLWRPYV